ncbi:MAG TPA: hypothetical protein VMS31_22790 [Pyrinomonadaceae bacterium]|nr:hypothetical protein [Pyrinomonadaceae bacterium]
MHQQLYTAVQDSPSHSAAITIRVEHLFDLYEKLAASLAPSRAETGAAKDKKNPIAKTRLRESQVIDDTANGKNARKLC